MKSVGRFSLSSKDRDTRAESFKRVDEKPINARPSSSGAGRKLTKKQKIRLGFEKEADIDPRLIQYGLPALLGAALGGVAGGGKLGALGALLGAGAGHYGFNGQAQNQVKNYLSSLLGGGAGTGVGSSAEPPASPSVPRVDSSAVAPAVTERAKEYVAAGVDVAEAHRLAAADVSQFLQSQGLEVGSPSAQVTSEEMARTGLRGLSVADQAAALSNRKATAPWWGTTMGTPLWAIESIRGALRGNLGDAAQAGAFGWGIPKITGGKTWVQSLKGLRAPGALSTAAGKLPGAITLWSAIGDLIDAGEGGLAAHVDPSASWFSRLRQRARIGGETVGRATLRDMYEPGGSMGTAGKLMAGTIGGMAKMPFAAATAQGDTARAVNEAQRRMAMQGLFTTRPGGGYEQDDQLSQALRRKIHRARVTSDPFTAVTNPYQSVTGMLGNAWNHWTR